MFLEEFRLLSVVGSGMAASSGLFTCFTIIPSRNEQYPITIELIVNGEREEIKTEDDVKEPEPVAEPEEEEVELPKDEPVVEAAPFEVADALPKQEVTEPTPLPVNPSKPKLVKKPKNRKGKLPRPKRINNYKSSKRDNRDVFHVIPNKGSPYWLYRPHGKLDFSFKFSNTKFPEIRKEDIKIKLFKKPVWEDHNLYSDEYGDRLNQSQINELFNTEEEIDENKIKQLLFSLSVKRHWEKHVGDHYNSGRPEGLDRRLWYMDIGIKYFTEFKDLKEYVHAKVATCEQQDPCVAQEEELSILPQDKISFFN